MGGIGLGNVPLPLAGRVGLGRIRYSCPTCLLMVSLLVNQTGVVGRVG